MKYLVHVLALLVAYAMKAFYSRAGAAALNWMLAPPCTLARWSGIDLRPELNAGFVSTTHHMIVGPACAGVNFLIVCFVALYFAFHARFAHPQKKLVWLAASLVIAYFAAILVNTMRIIVSAHLFDLPLEPGWLNAERLHRFIGTLVYCGGLLFVHLSAERFFGSVSLGARAVPFACYFALVLGAPLLLRHWNAQLGEHTVCVMAIAGSVLLLSMLGRVKASE